MINLNLFDVSVISIILIVSLLAFFRGFIKEFLSIISWLLALILSYTLGPIVVKSFFADSKYSTILVDVGVRTVIFTISLIILSITSSKINEALVDKLPTSINRSLGFATGFAKTYFIIALFFSILISFYSYEAVAPKDKNSEKTEKEKTKNADVKNSKTRVGPAWLKKSVSYGFLQFGAETLDPVTKIVMGVINKSDNVKSSTDHESNDLTDSIKKLEDINNQIQDNEESGPENNSDQTGYSKKDIQKLDHLIDVINK